MPRLFGAAAAEAWMMRSNFIKSVLIAFFFTGPVAAQTQTPAEPPAVEPAPETAPAEVVESAPPVDWAARASEAYIATYRETCAPQDEADKLELRKPDIHELKYRESSDEADQPDRTVTVYRFFCTRAAYNETHVYFMKNTFEEIQPLAFAEPAIHVEYENEDSEGKVLAVKIIGMESHNLLVNSDIDPAKKAVTSFSKWRGVGDASSSGVWVLRNGVFVLSTFEVDASYDGEINPKTVLDYRAENEALNETP
jgi:Protein of unknown function (DUF1176)